MFRLFSHLFLLWVLLVAYCTDVFARDPDLMPRQPVSPGDKGSELLNFVRIRPERDDGTYGRRFVEVFRAKRNLLQADEDDDDDNGSDFECSLTTRQVDEYLDASSRTWLIDDDGLQDLQNDLQAVVNCSEEGDVVLFNVSQAITPISRIIIPRRLTISGAVDDTELEEGVFPATSDRMIFNCPEENEGIFLMRSRSVLFANIIFDGCSFDASDELDGIIEVQECDTERVTDTVRLHHVGFTDNRLIGGVGLLMNSPSCSATELIDIEFRDNICKGFCGAVLSSENILEDAVIERNVHVGNADDIPAIISAPQGSTTTARDITAQNNAGTVILIDEGSLTLTASLFVENSADVTDDDDSFGSCLHLVQASAEVEGCEFFENEGDQGGVMYLKNSSVVIADCRFEDNSAEDGAVFYAKQRSRIQIDASEFSTNVAKNDGGVVHADDSDVVVADSSFDRNSAEVNGGCFWFIDSGSLNLKNCNFTKNAGAFGGVISFEEKGECSIQRCTFDGNDAKNSGGTVYLEKSAMIVESCHATDGNATAGGVFFLTQSTIQISHFRCQENKASRGGCLYAIKENSIEMVNVTVVANRASNEGGGLVIKQDSVCTVRQSNFTSNSADIQGGAFVFDSSKLNFSEAYVVDNIGPNGGGVVANNGTEVVITDVHFEGNKGEFGGAIVLDHNGDGSFANCSFIDNEVKTSGGSMYIEQSEATITNCGFRSGKAEFGGFVFSIRSELTISNVSFTKGSSVSSGGCLRVRDKPGVTTLQNVYFTFCNAGNGGGSIEVVNTTMALRNCTVSSSKGSVGGGIHSSASNVSVKVVLFEDGEAENGGGIYATDSGKLVVHNSRFLRNEADFGGGLVLLNVTGEVTTCSFEENEVTTRGGAVYMQSASGNLTDCELVNNSALAGGSISVSKQSSLRLSNSSCFVNKAIFGGCLRCFQGSHVDIRNVTMEDNKATEDGGALEADNKCVVRLQSCTLKSNGASNNGGAISLRESSLEGEDISIIGNAAKENGGGLYIKESTELSFFRSNFTGNFAQRGGAIVLHKIQRITFRNLTMTKNRASASGGCIYLEDSKANIEELQWFENEASIGGTMYIVDSFLNITNSTCRSSLSVREGGAIYAVDNSTLRMKDVHIKHARSGKGGGALFLQNSHLIAINLTAAYCRSRESGGIVMANATSTLLCDNCILKNSFAEEKGGAVSIESNETQLLAVQFQRSVIRNNSAKFGGGLHFLSPHQSGDCSKKGANCTFIALSDTLFKMNTASQAGGAIFAVDLKTIRIRCSADISMHGNVSFYTRDQWESMNVVRSLDDLCSTWKLNVAKVYGGKVGTYASLVNATIHEKAGPVDINAKSKPYVIQNHASGDPLPDIQLEIVDELGQGPAIGVNTRDVDAVMSSNGFFSGTITLSLKHGNGTFSEIIGFHVPKTYTIVIDFSEKSLKEVKFKVQIRSCIVGETATSNRRFCEPCSAATYSFHPEGRAPCLPCPENSNCTSIVIRPTKGYWNQFPCSEHIQRCLTKRACDYEARDVKLETLASQSKQCTFDNSTIEAYEAAMCRPGHKGPLCGSCDKNHGKSQSFNCEECFTRFGNVVLVLLSIMMLMGLAGFTARSNLMSFISLLQRREVNDGMPGSSSGPRREHDDLEIMERYYLGQAFEQDAEPSGIKRIDMRAKAARQAELAKWKAVELFKIAVNFVQITAIAIAVNVEWSFLLIGLFEAAEFAGGITSEATNRSVDCLVSENSSIPRSIVSTIIDLLVPAVVVGVFVCFWTVIALGKKETFGYLLKRSILSALAVFYISYISITKTLVNTLTCIEVHDSRTVMVDHTSDYWAVDTSLKCYEGSHSVLTSAVGWPLLFLFSLLFPIAVAVVIVYNVKQNYEDGWIYDVAGFMYRSYGRKYVFWESVIMLRKAVLAVVVVFAYPLESSLQTVLAVFVLVLSLYLQMMCRPYRKEFDSLNEMESVSLLVSLLTFVSSLCFDNDNVPFGIRIAITITVFLCNIGLFLFFAAFFFIFSTKHLKAVLDREGVPYQAEGGTVHILRVYFFVHLSGTILKRFGGCFKCLIGPRFYDTN